MNKKLLLIVVIFVISCNKNTSKESLVYQNDFENSNLAGISNGVINTFNNSSVLGQYYDSGFALKLNNLPKHDLVTVSFDLFIHDSWDGDKMAPDGPDIWELLIDGSPLINATFSNDACPDGFCSPQSYPFNYPNNYNNPKTGAYRTDLPGVCYLKDNPNGTTMYKIEKTFRHSDKTLLLQCLDKLVQSNAPDPKCDESWSVDNINVKVITL